MTAYHYAVLRYTHDVVTGESLNVGVVIYCPDDAWLDFKFESRSRRLSQAFKGFDRSTFSAFIRKLKRSLNDQGASLVEDSLFPSESLDTILNKSLVKDDTSFQFSNVGFGLTPDPIKELSNLFDRFVLCYTSGTRRASRDDDEIWSAFKQKLPRQDVLAKLVPITLRGEDIEQAFDHSWRNGQLNIAQLLSLDLVEPRSILDKAVLWKGRLNEIRENENFAVYFIVGMPSDAELRQVAEKAKHLLKKVQNVRIISEDKTEEFANEIVAQIEAHEALENITTD